MTSLILNLRAIPLIVTTSIVIAATASAQAETGGCAIKKQELQKQIDYARQFNNYNRVRGLETALKEVELHCTDAAVEAKQKADVDERRAEVAKSQAELDKAKISGDARKIDQKTEKLQKARQKLQDAKQKLLTR